MAGLAALTTGEKEMLHRKRTHTQTNTHTQANKNAHKQTKTHTISEANNDTFLTNKGSKRQLVHGLSLEPICIAQI